MSGPLYTFNAAPVTDPVELYGRQIWTSLFLTSVPLKDTMSPAYKKLFGMPTVGDPVIDKEMADQPLVTYITIDKMIEYFKKGVVVSVINHADTLIIYEIVDKYLQGWSNRLRDGINVGGAPMDDLRDLDNFAAVVYPYAQQHKRPDTWNSRFADFISGGGVFASRESLMRDRSVPEPDAPEAPAPQRESFSSVFAEGVLRGQGRAAPMDRQEALKSRWDRGR